MGTEDMGTWGHGDTGDKGHGDRGQGDRGHGDRGKRQHVKDIGFHVIHTHCVTHLQFSFRGGDRGHGTLGTTRGKGQHIQPIGLNCKLCLNYSKETPRGSSVDLG